jgi:hypothetical protein
MKKRIILWLLRLLTPKQERLFAVLYKHDEDIPVTETYWNRINVNREHMEEEYKLYSFPDARLVEVIIIDIHKFR